MSGRIRFTAEVEDMFGNMSLTEMSDEEVLQLLEDTYDIPKDCIEQFEVKA